MKILGLGVYIEFIIVNKPFYRYSGSIMEYEMNNIEIVRTIGDEEI